MKPRDDPAARRQRLLFDEIVDLAPDERAARVRRLDPNDADIARVVRLLEAHDHAAEQLDALEFLRARDAPGRADSSFDAVAAFAPSYAIEGELHGGGMSRVFVGRDATLGRKIVAKVLPPDLGAEVNLGRFQKEIRLAAQLRHPHIVPLLQSGEAAGCLYYTMPLIEGESLRDRLRRDGKLPVPVALRFATEIADALGYAHGLGIIHRDIKPGNVLIDSGHAIVADFGIARALSDAATATNTRSGTVTGTPAYISTVIGTPAYMSPEQASGDGVVDARSDVYSLGCVLYEMLYGARPFAAADAVAPVERASEPRVPARVRSIVARAMASRPIERFQSAQDMHEALLVATAQLIAADIAETPAFAIPAARAQRRHATPLALAVLALALLAGGAWAWRARAGAAPDAHARPDAAPAEPPLVAVLPFETAGGATGVAPDTAFANGLGDAITGKLARLQGLRVIARASVRKVDGAAAHPQAAGRALGADYVLGATLRWAMGADGQPRVQVGPVLIRVTDGTTMWAGEPTVVAPSDPFAAQGALATAVAEALDVALAPGERVRLAQPSTTDTAAFAAVERGGRMMGYARTQADRVQVLREFERAYRRDPQYADAFGKAADVLLWMVHFGAPQAYWDSAAVLARRALALDPGQVDAESVLARFEETQGRVDEGTRLIEQAARAFPSSAPLQLLLASTLQQDRGDTAGAVDAVNRARALAPRSRDNVFLAFYLMLSLRRYDDARDLVARARALEPEWLGVPTMAADLAHAVGDTAGVSAAMRTLRAAGQGAQMLDQMRSGDAALQRELAAVSLASLGASTAVDSNRYYRVKAQLYLARGEGAKARALVDSGYRLAASHAANLPAGANDVQYWWRHVAWYAAARRDRPAAVAALRQSAEVKGPLIAGHPGNQFDAFQTCTSAEVYGLLGDGEAMLPLLRRCLTMPNGYHLAQLGQPAFARFRADPRMRRLATEIATAQARIRSTPVRAGR